VNRWDAAIPNPEESRDHDGLESVIHSDLSRPCATPDLTESIMEELGFHRGDAAARRKESLQRWGRRCSVAVAASVALYVGVFVHQAGPDARRASDLSIPSAIQNDINRHEQSVGQLIQTIRQLTPPASQYSAPTPAPGTIDDPSTEIPGDLPLFSPTMDPAAAAPFQWV
jgi:hypothetical protein